MVSVDDALFHCFLELPIDYWICRVQPDTPEDVLMFKMAALELGFCAVPPNPFSAIIPQGRR